MPEIKYAVDDRFLEYAMVLDETFTTKMLIDSFSSFVWTERYDSSGDFELTMPVEEKIVKDLNLDDYLAIKESNVVMVIETMTVEASEENGDMLTISGRSLECLLERRVIWGTFESPKTTKFQDAIKKMLEQNAISPADSKRQIPGLEFKASEDEKILELAEEIKMVGENLYDAIVQLCSAHQLGFRILPSGEGKMTFELYYGEDRTWSQDKNPAVVFSNSYENLLNSNFLQSEIDYCSNALVVSDSLQMEVYRRPERTGLKRRELYVDISESQEEGDTTSSKDWLFGKAKEVMAEHTVTVAFGSDVVPYIQFIYDKDYFIGDIVQVQNRYGFEGRCRISEVVRARDAGGPTMTPTFMAVNDDNEEVKT